MTTLSYRTVESPIGPLTLAGVDSTLMHLTMADQTHEPDRTGWRLGGPRQFADVIAQLDAYFAGRLTEFEVTLDADGTEFQRRVWSALRTIPYGETRSYGEIAAQIGSPAASRAVGLANGRNPISIVVPCHRVIGSTGRLTGYGGGLVRKRLLLDLEISPGQGKPKLR